MDTASHFLQEMFGNGRSIASVCVVSYANDRNQIKKFPPVEIYTRDPISIAALLKKCDKPGRAVYFGVNPIIKGKTRSKENVAEIISFWSDLDFKGIVEDRKQIEAVLVQLPLKVSRLIFSGHGLHPYWFTKVPAALIERVEAVLRRLCWALAGDPAVCEIARVMRLPGSHNSKAEGEWIEVEVIHSNDTTCTLEDMEEWLASLTEPLLHRVGSNPKAGNGQAAYGDPYASAAQDQVTPEPIDVTQALVEMQYHGTVGNGVNLTQFRVIGSLLYEGVAVDEAIEYVVDQTWALIPESITWSRRGEVNQLRDMSVRTFRNHPELLDHQQQLPQWLERRLDRQSPAPASKDKPEKSKKPPPVLDRLFLEDLQDRPIVARKWIVNGFILAEQLNGMFGDGGMGKDYLLLQLGIAMTCGAKWLGHDVMQGRVMYFPVEDDLNEVRRREDKITKYMISMGQYHPHPKHLMIVPMVGVDAVLGVFDSRSGLVKPTEVYDSIKLMVAEFKPDLMIVGNRVNIFSVNQNEDAHAVQCLRLLNALCVEFQTAVLMPGHVSVRGMETGTGTSGTVQWSNGVRARTFLRRPKEQEDDLDSNLRELQVMKINWGPSDAQINMTWSEPGLFVPTNITMTPKPDAQPQPGESEAEAKARERKELEADVENECMRMINKAVAIGQRLSPNIKANNYPPTLFARSEPFKECKYRNDKGFKLFTAALGRLFMRGKIRSISYGSPSAGTKEILPNVDPE